MSCQAGYRKDIGRGGYCLLDPPSGVPWGTYNIAEPTSQSCLDMNPSDHSVIMGTDCINPLYVVTNRIIQRRTDIAPSTWTLSVDDQYVLFWKADDDNSRTASTQTFIIVDSNHIYAPDLNYYVCRNPLRLISQAQLPTYVDDATWDFTRLTVNDYQPPDACGDNYTVDCTSQDHCYCVATVPNNQKYAMPIQEKKWYDICVGDQPCTFQVDPNDTTTMALFDNGCVGPFIPSPDVKQTCYLPNLSQSKTQYNRCNSDPFEGYGKCKPKSKYSSDSVCWDGWQNKSNPNQTQATLSCSGNCSIFKGRKCGCYCTNVYVPRNYLYCEDIYGQNSGQWLACDRQTAGWFLDSTYAQGDGYKYYPKQSDFDSICKAPYQPAS